MANISTSELIYPLMTSSAQKIKNQWGLRATDSEELKQAKMRRDRKDSSEVPQI